ncbi:MAG TPA: IS1595 family transposase [Gaiellaceae bacterium]|nr:IS1595 family transposase [Gaiellaceae bacterium]
MAAANRKNPQRVKSSESLYSLREFLAEFPDDETCLEYLWRERHSPDGTHAHCPKCDQEREFKRYATKQQRQSWTCVGCGHHIHPTAGTIFAKSSRPLTEWFYAMFLVSSSRCGIAAKQLERELGCNYKTAWRMLNRVRNVLMEQEDSPLFGHVEADETYVGGKPRAWPKTSRADKLAKKVTVAAAVQRKGGVRASVVPTSQAASVRTMVESFILPGSIVYTDESHIYNDHGFRTRYGHRTIKHHAKIYVSGETHTQTIEGFFALVKNGIRGTHHSVSRGWLQGYLNEYVWKWNRRRDDEAMFRQLLASAAGV